VRLDLSQSLFARTSRHSTAKRVTCTNKVGPLGCKHDFCQPHPRPEEEKLASCSEPNGEVCAALHLLQSGDVQEAVDSGEVGIMLGCGGCAIAAGFPCASSDARVHAISHSLASEYCPNRNDLDTTTQRLKRHGHSNAFVAK
jgi:hypothetical protein